MSEFFSWKIMQGNEERERRTHFSTGFQKRKSSRALNIKQITGLKKTKIFLCLSSLFLFVLDFSLSVQPGLSVLIDTTSGTFPHQRMTIAPVLLIFAYELSLSLLYKTTIAQVLATVAPCALPCRQYPNTATFFFRVFGSFFSFPHSYVFPLVLHWSMQDAFRLCLWHSSQLFSTSLLPQLLQRSN